MKKLIKINIIKVLIVFSVIALDLISKHFFYQTDVNIIPKLIGFRYVSGLNTGGAWTILSSSTTLLVVITIIVIVAFSIFDVFYKKTNVIYSLSVSFLVGGAIGNLIDRIALGGVRDFIFFPFMPSFPTFNLADTFIFIGAVLLFVYVIFLFKPNKKAEKQTNTEQEKQTTNKEQENASFSEQYHTNNTPIVKSNSKTTTKQEELRSKKETSNVTAKHTKKSTAQNSSKSPKEKNKP